MRVASLLLITLLAGCAAPAPTPAPRLAPERAQAPPPAPARAAPARAAPAAPARERVSVSFRATPLPEALAVLGAKVGWNIVVQPGVTTPVDLRLRDVPWRVALNLILKRTRCEARRRGERLLYVHEPPRVTYSTYAG